MIAPRGIVATLVVALFAVLLTACSSGQPAARTLAHDAMHAFHDAPVKTIKGSFTDGVIPVSVAVTEDSHGDAGGSGTFDHFPVAFLRVGGSTYVQGEAYWHWARLSGWPAWPQLGQQWVLTGPDPATSAFQIASRAAGTLAPLQEHAATMSVGSPVRRESRWIYPLTYGSMTYDVTADWHHRLVAVHDDTARAGANLLTGTELRISYGGTLHAAGPGPGQYVNVGDPTTLPARYTDLGSVQPATCDRIGCTLTEKIGNDGGAPVGESVLTVTYYEYSDRQEALSSCQSAIPAIPHNGNAEVSCEATGVDLVSWTSLYQYWWGTTITNPPYDP